MMGLVDLHCHTTASDGALTPAQLLKEAGRIGLAALAVTDHDTVGGIDEALAAGAAEGVEVIPGIEFSVLAEVPGFTHLLGLFIDHRHPALALALTRIVESRHQRNLKIIDRLNELGLELTREEVVEISGGGLVGRPHIGQAMVNRGYVGSLDEAMSRYIKKGGPAYVDRFRLTTGRAAAVIHEIGGLAVLAHPVSMGLEGIKLKAKLTGLKAAGLDAIEVFCPTQDQDQRQILLILARTLNLLVSGGSDFHGAYKPDIRLGIGRGDLSLREDLLETLRAAATGRRRACAGVS
jgi:predicted metal-dependent phosphoesterase TrpH